MKKVFTITIIAAMAMSINALGENLVYNGDFSITGPTVGAMGFISQYVLKTDLADEDVWPLWPAGTIAVGTSPYNYHWGFANYGDHTTGTGNMLIVNGATTTSPLKIVWQQNEITVTPYTWYKLSYWLSSCAEGNWANIRCDMRGGNVSDFFVSLGTDAVPTTLGEWVQVSYCWYSGDNTEARIRLIDLITEAGGNDFAIDDISLEECPWYGETAWSAGIRYVTKGNWATYTPYVADSTVTLYADQSMEAGTVTFSAAVDGEVEITITLNEGWRFADVEENVKIQGYESAPSAKPEPGLFENKGDASVSPFVIIVPEAYFYGVHVDVEWQAPCCDEI